MYQGDPKLFMTPDGVTLSFLGGQPVMDRGLENMALISLFTAPHWCGNTFLTSPVGATVEEEANQPIVRQTIQRVRSAAEAALRHKAFGAAVVEVSNPTGYQLSILATIQPPGSNPEELQYTRYGATWAAQAEG